MPQIPPFPDAVFGLDFRTLAMRCSNRQFLFLVFIVGLVLMHESRTAPFQAVDAAYTTWLAANAPRHVPPAPLALVQITGEELGANPWPLPPTDYSLFLNAALPFQPPVLAIEPVLAWPKPDPQQVALLHNQTLRAPKMLLGSDFGFPEDPATVPPLQEVPVLRHVEGSATGIREFPWIAAQPGEELRLSATLGFFEPAPAAGSEEAAGPVRRVPLVYRYRGQVVPSFVLQAAMLWLGVTPEEVTVAPGSHIALGSELRVPVDEAGTMPVDFTIPVIRFSLGDLLLSAEQNQSGHTAVAPVGHLKNTLTLLARTDDGARTIPLANGRNGSRGELAAAAIATIQKGSFPVRAGAYVEWVIVLEAAVLGWFCQRMRKGAAGALCIGIFAVYLLGSLGAFAAWQVALPLVLPAGLLAFLAVFRQCE